MGANKEVFVITFLFLVLAVFVIGVEEQLTRGGSGVSLEQTRETSGTTDPLANTRVDPTPFVEPDPPPVIDPTPPIDPRLLTEQFKEENGILGPDDLENIGTSDPITTQTPSTDPPQRVEEKPSPTPFVEDPVRNDPGIIPPDPRLEEERNDPLNLPTVELDPTISPFPSVLPSPVDTSVPSSSFPSVSPSSSPTFLDPPPAEPSERIDALNRPLPVESTQPLTREEVTRLLERALNKPPTEEEILQFLSSQELFVQEQILTREQLNQEIENTQVALNTDLGLRREQGDPLLAEENLLPSDIDPRLISKQEEELRRINTLNDPRFLDGVDDEEGRVLFGGVEDKQKNGFEDDGKDDVEFDSEGKPKRPQRFFVQERLEAEFRDSAKRQVLEELASYREEPVETKPRRLLKPSSGAVIQSINRLETVKKAKPVEVKHNDITVQYKRTTRALSIEKRKKPKVTLDNDVHTEFIIDLKPRKVLYNFTVYEDIPKSVAEHASEILFSNQNFTIIEEDPLFAWHFAVLDEPVEITYVVTKEVEEVPVSIPVAEEVSSEDVSNDVPVWKATLPVLIIPLCVIIYVFFSRFALKK